MKEGGTRFTEPPLSIETGKPLISIITVVYNAQEIILPTLLSIFNQTYVNIEFILIDGASTDKTLELALTYAGKIAYWRSEKDSGIYDAMNKGLSAAQGDYVYFLNAGDQLYDHQVLEKIFSGSVHADLYYGHTELIDQAGKSLGLRRHQPPAILNWKSFKKGMLVGHQAFIPARSVTRPYRTDLKVSADIDWCIDCMKKAGTIVNTQLVIAKYLTGGLSRQNTLLSWKERFTVMQHHYGLFSTFMAHIRIVFRFAGYFMASRNLD